MSVLPMKRVFIAALKKDRKSIVECLQRLGVVEINTESTASLFGEVREDSVFEQIDTSSARTTFEKNSNLATQALLVLDREFPEEKGMLASFEGREKMTHSKYETLVTRRDEIMDVVYHLNNLNKQKLEAEAEIPKLINQLEMLTPWLSFDLPLDYSGTRHTSAYVGTLQSKYSEEEIKALFSEKAPTLDMIDISVISSTEEQTALMVLCHKSQAKETEDVLRSLGFSKPALPPVVPTELEKELKASLKEQEAKVVEVKKEIEKYANMRYELTFIIDYFSLRAEKYSLIGDLYQSKNVFFISGYVASKDVKLLEEKLNEFDVISEYTDPADDENVPVILSNNAYSRPIEGVVAGYSLPGRGEVDPTFIASLFYYGLYGLMLSDAAYGLIMVFATLFVLKKFKGRLEEGTKRMLEMFFGCGVATTIWGFIFGSFFGDVIPKVSETFFGTRVDLPRLLDSVADPVTLLGIAFIIGITHLFCGLGIAFYTKLKQKSYTEAIFDVFCWYLLFGGAVGLLITTNMIQEMFKFSINFPPFVVSIFTVITLLGAVGILLMGGRESKNPVKRLLKGLYALYGISGYLSDVLSYSRLLALGLATGVISQVFNTIATMPGASLFGAVFFIVIFVIGHTINILINALGAYVHTNRLEYVEFFGKFYNGGGKEFTPFKENTKYFTVK